MYISCIYVYMYICIYICMYICIYVYMYICIYVCTYSRKLVSAPRWERDCDGHYFLFVYRLLFSPPHLHHHLLLLLLTCSTTSSLIMRLYRRCDLIYRPVI